MFSQRASALAVVIVLLLSGSTNGQHPVADDALPLAAGAAAHVAATGAQGAVTAVRSGPARVLDGGLTSDVAGGDPADDWPDLTVPGAKPNIVVFYLDDTSPAEAVLWNNPARTPTLHSLFVERGIHFPNAIGETPLCCPGRANLLTGLHTHNHGVLYNDVQLFDPTEHVGRALKANGYATSWIGKYMNHPDRLSAAAWTRHAAGWTQLDVFRNDAFDGSAKYYYDYDMFTKQGDVHYGQYHSTRMMADRAVLRMNQTDPSTPLFMVISIYNTHGPNVPMPEFKGDPRCADMPAWKPPNYNEADVSDKPAYIRSRPLLPSSAGWPMKTYCEEMLGVDWLVKRVTDKLAALGRLDDTLLVFTADNGMGWGQHRLGQEKQTPYVTPVPLYFSWPARWGDTGRTVDDIAVNIDLAPTFCALGGCSLGPYRSGQSRPDGVNLMPLLDGQAANLGRDAVLEGNYSKRPFTGLRTTPSNPLGRWHYVEYKDGFRELYNLATDPWELENLAYDPSTASLRSTLATRLAQLRREGHAGGGTATPRPDAMIAFTAGGTYVANNVYSAVPVAEQTRKRTGVARGASYDYFVRIQNDGAVAASFNVYGESSGSATMTARYFVGATDVTADVTAGSYTINNLAAGAKVTMTVRIRVGSTAALGAKKTVLLRVASVDNPSLVDIVRAIAVR